MGGPGPAKVGSGWYLLITWPYSTDHVATIVTATAEQCQSVESGTMVIRNVAGAKTDENDNWPSQFVTRD